MMHRRTGFWTAVVWLVVGAAQAGAQSVPQTPTPRPFPLTTCPVSGDDLGAMGEPETRVVDGREVRFCCDGCVEDFKADSERFWKTVDAQIVGQQLMHYPLDSCIVSGEPLVEDGEDIGVNVVHDNRLVRLCCKMCRRDFSEDPSSFMQRLDEKIAETQRESYPLDECVISGMELGSMGEPAEIVYQNRLVRFCCGGCIEKFNRHPAEAMEKIDTAYAAAQRESYPLEECVVSGMALGSMGEPFELVAGTRLVRFCCEGCVGDFKAEPEKYLAKLKSEDD